MLPAPPLIISVVHAGEVVAICTPNQAFLAAVIEAMPFSHPDRALVEVKCLIASGTLRGEFDGPYDDAIAEAAAIELTDGPEEQLP